MADPRQSTPLFCPRTAIPSFTKTTVLFLLTLLLVVSMTWADSVSYTVDAGTVYSEQPPRDDMAMWKHWANGSASLSFAWDYRYVDRLQRIGGTELHRVDVNHGIFCERVGGNLVYPTDKPLYGLDELLGKIKTWCWNTGAVPHMLLSMDMSEQLSLNPYPEITDPDHDNHYRFYPPADWAEYEECMYQLLKYLNVTCKANILYWEFTTEPDVRTGYYHDVGGSLVAENSHASEGMYQVFYEKYRHLAAAFDRFEADYGIPVKLCGPGCTSAYCWHDHAWSYNWYRAFIEDCAADDTRLDMVTYHPYADHASVGERVNYSDAYPPIQDMMGDVQGWIDANYPTPTRDKPPIWVSESGMQVWIGDQKSVDQNGTNVIAAFTPSMWYQFLNLDVAQVSQLTVTDEWYEGANNWGWSSFFTNPAIDSKGPITKAIYNFCRMSMLMADERVSVTGGTIASQMLAAKNDDKVTMLVWNADYDAHDNVTRAPSLDVTVTINNLPFTGNVAYERYLIDETHSNAYYLWDNSLPFDGSEELQKVEGPTTLTTSGSSITLPTRTMAPESVMLLVLSSHPTDTEAPTGTTASSPAYSTNSSFTVSWSGATDTGGSGLSGEYDVYVKDGHNDMWSLWLDNYAGTSATYNGQMGHAYYFGAVAIDNAGNVETDYQGGVYDWGETRTVVTASPPTVTEPYEWHFMADGDHEGWNKTEGTYWNYGMAYDDCLHLMSRSSVGYVFSPEFLPPFDADDYPHIYMRANFPTSLGGIALYFITDTDPVWSDSKSYGIEVTSPGVFAEYDFDMGRCETWDGTITRFRIVCMAAYENSAVDWIKLSDDPSYNPDLDFDRYVDPNDLMLMAGNWLATGTDLDGDIDGDGLVSLADLPYMQREWTGYDVTPPTTPTGLTVTGSTETSVSLEWNAASDDMRLSGYNIYRNGVFVDSTWRTTFTDDEGLTPGTAYTYSVCAYDRAKNKSPWSSPVVATTTAVDIYPPSIPTGLTVTDQTAVSIALSWNASTDTGGGVTGYRVFRDGGSVGTIGGTAYTDSGLESETSYTYTVTAFDAETNESPQSTPAVGTTTALVNYLLNPSFELDNDSNGYPDNWGPWYGSGDATRVSASPYHGSYCCQVVNPGEQGDAYVQQTGLSLTAGNSYKLSGWIKTSGLASGGLFFRYVGGVVVGTWGNEVNSTDWVYRETESFDGSGSVRVDLNYGNLGATETGWYDHMILTDY